MTAQVLARESNWRVVFDGQSLNILGQFPGQLMAMYPGVPWTNPSVGSSSWDVLLNGGYNANAVRKNVDPAATRVFPFVNKNQKTVLIMNGGTADFDYEGDTAAEVMTDTKAYATAARAAGVDYIIVLSTCKFGGITGGQDTERIAFNTNLMADVTGAFDYMVDVANDGTVKTGAGVVVASPGNTHLSDPTNATYYIGDHIHWSLTGGLEAANMVKPALDDLGVTA